ncbi:hypothetical protein QTP88_029500 [Uroleucon formosanum]
MDVWTTMNSRKRVCTVGETRWSKDASFANQNLCIKSEARFKASGVKAGLCKYEIILTAQMYLRIFEKTTPLFKYLQGKEINIMTAYQMCQLKEEFEIEDCGILNYYLGIKIEHNVDKAELKISQGQYLKNVLQHFNMSDCKPRSIPIETKLDLFINTLTTTCSQPYRQLIGCLMYAMLATQPGLSYCLNYFSNFSSLDASKNVLRYIKGTLNHSIIYKKQTITPILEGYVDAYWANHKDRKSVTAYIFKIYESIVSWSTNRQPTITLLTTEAEYMAVSYATCEAIWSRNILKDFGVELSKPITLYEDNQSCIQLLQNPGHHRRTKHIDIRHHFIREKVEEGVVTLKYIISENQQVDILTKGLPVNKFNHLVKLIMN